MNEWKNPAKELPADDTHVDIRVSGRTIKNVLFTEGRFWKYRKAPRVGHAYNVESWRYHELKKKGARADGTGRAGEGTAEAFPEGAD